MDLCDNNDFNLRIDRSTAAAVYSAAKALSQARELALMQQNMQDAQSAGARLLGRKLGLDRSVPGIDANRFAWIETSRHR